MAEAGDLTDIERLIALQDIYRLKARRDHAVDQKDWETYAALGLKDVQLVAGPDLL